MQVLPQSMEATPDGVKEVTVKTLFAKSVTIVITLALVAMLVPPAVLADDAPPDDTPSMVERVVSKGTDAICDSMWWQAQTDLIEYWWGNSKIYDWSQSLSRASSDHSWPCDIDSIGSRSRIWKDSVLQNDTGQQNVANSAEKTTQTTDQLGSCSGAAWQGRGNHIFEESGISPWYPETNETC